MDPESLEKWLKGRKAHPKTTRLKVLYAAHPDSCFFDSHLTSLSSFISGRRSRQSFHVHVDPTVLTLLRDESGLSEKFISNVYETEDWTRLAFGSTLRKDSDRKLESLGSKYS